MFVVAVVYVLDVVIVALACCCCCFHGSQSTDIDAFLETLHSEGCM